MRFEDKPPLMTIEPTYDKLATEYYSRSHKTSRNFDDATVVAMRTLKARVPQVGLVLEVGAGRGRANEFLGIAAERIVQLDNSPAMLSVEPREKALLQVLHEAEALPFPDRTFSVVVSFLCDPFLGLDFLAQAHRVLAPGGMLVATTPSYEWGEPLRRELGLDTATTRFLTENGVIKAPSLLVRREQLVDMASVVGFDSSSIQVTSHRLPQDSEPVSDDILTPAKTLGCSVHELDLIYCLVAQR